MSHTASSSTLELLAWVSSRRATYAEVMDAWSSWCPRHAVWEDALVDGLVRVVRIEGRSEVALTPRGVAVLYGATENGRLTAAAKAAVAATDAR
jgi:hypothetical protein